MNEEGQESTYWTVYSKPGYQLHAEMRKDGYALWESRVLVDRMTRDEATKILDHMADIHKKGE